MSKSWWVSVVTWLGTQGLQILLIIIGSILLARLAGFVSHRVTRSIARGEKDRDSLVQSETAKHRYVWHKLLPMWWWLLLSSLRQ